MKEYIVSEIRCKKNLKISEIYSYVKDKVKYNSNLFAFQNIKLDSISGECKRIYNELNLDKYAYKKVLEHIAKTPYYNPERDDRRMVSNLNSIWNWCNESINTPLGVEDFESLVKFSDKLKSFDVSTLMLGLDEIEWGGSKVGKGSYGYKKADCTYGLGKNYLSNSLIVGRVGGDKTYTAYVSCESIFYELDIVKEIIDFLGEKISEVTCFAPECDAEREEWNVTAKDADNKFKAAMDGFNELALETIDKSGTADEKQKINIKKYINKYLCSDGWEVRKALADESPTVVHKMKQESDICISVVSGHNGHHLQALVYYRSKKFMFCEHIYALNVNSISESEIEKYFRNCVTIKNYLYDVL